MSILNPLYEAVAWVMMQIHAGLAVLFGTSSGWAWGLSIVLLVMLMRAIMVPLFVRQVKTQRKMQAHMPQLAEIRKKYKNDKQRLNEETMKFYKENGLNPLGGCLPLVAQLPVFYALFHVLEAISDWKPGSTPQYGLTTKVVESARDAHIFGASLADRFLYPIPEEHGSSRIVILIFVLVSAATTFLTMRQSAKRGMLNQTPPDPDQPGAQMAASMSKNMMYIAPLFALSGLYWQFGLVIYWVTTNVWTLCQQHILFRNLPVVGSATVGASAVGAASGNTGAAVKNSGASSSSAARAKAVTPKASATAKAPAAKAPAAKAPAAKTQATKAPAAKAPAAKGPASTAAANGGTTSGNGAGRGLLKFGKNKAEPEAVPAAPQTRVVRQQPVRQSRSKRGNTGKR